MKTLSLSLYATSLCGAVIFVTACSGTQSTSLPQQTLRFERTVGGAFRTTLAGTEAVLYRFGGGYFGSDGETPKAGLVNLNGTLYGTTTGPGGGTVYSISTSGTQRVLHNFSFNFGREGSVPLAGLVDVAGTLYGTTSAGGLLCRPAGCGTVFSITTAGALKVLHSFGGGVWNELVSRQRCFVIASRPSRVTLASPYIGTTRFSGGGTAALNEGSWNSTGVQRSSQSSSESNMHGSQRPRSGGAKLGARLSEIQASARGCRGLRSTSVKAA